MQIGSSAAEDEEEETYLEAIADEQDHWMREPPPVDSALLSEQELAEAMQQAMTGPVLQGTQFGLTSGSDRSGSSASATTSTSTSYGGVKSLPAVSYVHWQQKTEQPGSMPVILIDVRSPEEQKAVGMPPGSMPVPLELMRREVAAGWQQLAAIGILDSGDYRATQAVIRLRQVYGLSNVLVVTDWLTQDAASPAGE